MTQRKKYRHNNELKYVTSLIEEEVKSTLLELSPEAPKDAEFGEFLWADPEAGMRTDDAIEKDTLSEREFLDALKYHYDGFHNNEIGSINLEKFITAKTGLQYMKQNNMYSKYINPPNQMVYRGLVVSLKTAAALLGLWEEQFTINPLEAMAVGPGTLFDEKNKIQSWTTSIQKTDEFMWATSGRVIILFQANPNDAGNDFYLNPEELKKTFGTNVTGDYEEDEVISYGPAKYHKAVYLYYASHPPTSSKFLSQYEAIEEVIKLMKK